MTLDPRLIAALRRAAREARDTYVGRHWPSMGDARRDGIGFGLVEDRAHERSIRRFVATFQPDLMVDLLDEMKRLLDVAEAARLGQGALNWLVSTGPIIDGTEDDVHAAIYSASRALDATLARLDGAL